MSRYFMFVVNNPDGTTQREIEDWLDERATYYVWQMEIGESGTPHMQGFVQMEKIIKLTTLANLKWHCTPGPTGREQIRHTMR